MEGKGRERGKTQYIVAVALVDIDVEAKVLFDSLQIPIHTSSNKFVDLLSKQNQTNETKPN